MKSFKRMLTAMLLVLGVFLIAACGNSSKEEKALEVQFVPTNNDGTMEAKAKPFEKYLSEKLGRDVNVTLATDYSTIVEAMASGKVDIGIMPPAAYVQARGQDAAEAVLTSELGKFDEETGLPLEGETTPTFKGEILVKADSDIQTLEDLKGKRIATLSPASASGYIYPVAELKDAGLEPNTDYTVTTVNDIPSQITAVLNGQQDAAFVFQGSRIVFGGAFGDTDLMEEIRVLYLSKGDIPNDAIAVQPDMDPELKAKVKEAFLEMSDSEDGKEAMSMWNHLGYHEANEEAYDTVEEYTSRVAE